MKNKAVFEVRLDPEVYKKLMYVAEFEGRSLNNHILHLARTNISYHERVHGRIKTSDTEKIPLPNSASTPASGPASSADGAKAAEAPRDAENNENNENKNL